MHKCHLDSDTKIEALPWVVMKSESLNTQLDPNKTAAPPKASSAMQYILQLNIS